MIDYRKNKLDANHLSLVAALQARGVMVEQLGQPVDILGAYRGFTGFGEIKIKGSAAKFTRVQLQWIARTRWPIAIVHDIDEAMEYFTSGNGLTDSDKYRLQQLLDGDRQRRFFTPAEVSKALCFRGMM